MADLADLSLPVRMFLTAYRWRRIDPVPWAPPAKPLAESRVVLVSSAGFVLPGQEPFDDSIRGGDTSFRVIPGDTDPSALIDTHRSGAFDHAGLRQDPNLALPLDRLRELARTRRIGEVAPRHLSFMGSITAPGRLMRDSVPAAAELLVEDHVDVALLVPV
ncbi:MAG TPA: glycine/sarcosine/betaine reductase selenoprotein B family protein [Thermoanaerobaculia bacterium]|nr:glycine/sarcosine/betaine reductase selenoprotein B family protein [Thermoanaerobaculia bacterium]